MNRWRYKIKVKHLLNSESTNEEPEVIGTKIANILEKIQSRYFKDDYVLDDIILQFNSISTIRGWRALCEESQKVWEDYPPIEELNQSLRSLYDWADNNKVLID